MANVLEKYEETISEMKADVEATITSANETYEAKRKARVNLETQLSELKKIKEENYSKFLNVAKEFVKLLIKSFFKRRATIESFMRAIHPVNEYIKYSNWIDETNKQLQEAKREEGKAQRELSSALKLLENINAIVG